MRSEDSVATRHPLRSLAGDPSITQRWITRLRPRVMTKLNEMTLSAIALKGEIDERDSK
jgi:hypothetical protein